MTLLQEIKFRWTQESPRFWKALKHFWLTVASISGLIVGMEVAEINILREVLPVEWSKYADKVVHYALAISVISALQARLAVKNPEAIPNNNEPVN